MEHRARCMSSHSRYLMTGWNKMGRQGRAGQKPFSIITPLSLALRGDSCQQGKLVCDHPLEDLRVPSPLKATATHSPPRSQCSVEQVIYCSDASVGIQIH